MSTKKRSSEAAAPEGAQRKKAKISEIPKSVPSVLRQEEVDFPRGGGTNLTAVEYKTIRSEALRELNNEDVFKDSALKEKPARKEKKNRKSEMVKGKSKLALGTTLDSKQNAVRVEHLNYKRVVPGMKTLCQIISIYPLMLIVSLPNQLLGHIPITHISSQLTNALEAAELNEPSEEDSEEEVQGANIPPDLSELFLPGQYVRAVVTAVKPPGTTEGGIFTHSRDNIEKSSRRVELSLIPDQVNSGLVKSDLIKGFTLCAAVKSVEDHGYILDVGLPTVSGFLRYSSNSSSDTRRPIGSLVDVSVEKLAEDGRTCLFTANEMEFKTTILKSITNVSSVLPGILVQALVTSITPSGLVVQILGSFDGTIDLYHLPVGSSPSEFKLGKKIKARILYNVAGTSPPQFALSLKEHVIDLDVKRATTEGNLPIPEQYPVGTSLPSITVKRVEPERGLIVSIEEGVDGFVHISHVSDDHVPSLSANSGSWKLESSHPARVVGFHHLDGILQLSLKQSVLSQNFLRVDDVKVGELVKGTVRKLADSCLFVSINGNVDAMIWPVHYADIMLKHPQKRFKPGASIKCRILAVEPSRKRILLTAKKSLVETDLQLITKLEDVEAGLLTHGVISRVLEKSLLVEFFNNIRAIVPMREVSETPVTDLSESFPMGKTVKVRILSVDRDSARIVASIRQASGDTSTLGDIKSVEIGQNVSGTIIDVHEENVLLVLDTSRARALISLHNISNHRRVPVTEIRSSLKSGQKLENLVVVSRNLDKGIVIVANKPSKGSQSAKVKALDLRSLTVGSTVTGRVVKHGRHGTFLKYPGWVTGILHPTDICDNYEDYKEASPDVDTTVTAVVVDMDKAKKHLTLSTRKSRMGSSSKEKIVDREICGLGDLKVGEKVRGFVKSIAEHGLFVTVGRGIDARVQIKELFDEYVKDWKPHFQEKQLVHGRILSIDSTKNQVEMSLRSKEGPSKELSINDLNQGQKIDGTIKKVEDYGVFINLNGTRLTGLCHKSEISDNKEADVSLALRNFREGDIVKAIVLDVDLEKKRISLGLKPSYFLDDILQSSDNSEDDVMSEVEDNDMAMDQGHSSDIEKVHENPIQDDTDEDDEEHEAMDIDVSAFAKQDNESTQDEKLDKKDNNLKPVLSLQGFQWSNADQLAEEEDVTTSDSDSNLDEPSGKKRKKKKAIEQDKTAEMHTRKPESIADFERHLLASPSSSYLWIQYMSFQLQLSEIDKAREIAKRALQAINIREEQERLNVWIALLNLENTFGTDESLEAIFKDAARHMDSKTIHLRLASIFDQSEKHEKAEEQYKRTCKKFGQSSKVWTLFGEHYLRRGLVEEARKLLPRSLQSLEKRKHIKTISKFALLEYKLGDPERGKTIYEGIVDSHPKRWDLWSVYIDMEATQKNIQGIRNLFDRVLSHKMTSHKAKSFFKKWLVLEQRIGDEDGQQAVKEKAIEWTQKSASS